MTAVTYACWPYPWHSVQFKMVSMRSQKPISTPHCVSQKFPHHGPQNSSNVHLFDDGPSSCFQGSLSSAPSFYLAQYPEHHAEESWGRNWASKPFPAVAYTVSETLAGEQDSSVVRVPDSRLKGHGFEFRQEWQENFLLQGHLSVLTLISVSVPPPCHHSST